MQALDELVATSARASAERAEPLFLERHDLPPCGGYCLPPRVRDAHRNRPGIGGMLLPSNHARPLESANELGDMDPVEPTEVRQLALPGCVPGCGDGVQGGEHGVLGGRQSQRRKGVIELQLPSRRELPDQEAHRGRRNVCGISHVIMLPQL